ncbi:hypothetical protein LTR17_010826 [Elasticomyces elasticus]|nr:hypothetical protein LTR17_010826 [Elasticomyces elasticus]
MPLSKKFRCASDLVQRGSSPEEVHEEWTEPKPKKARVTKVAAAKDAGNCSMNKKEIGDNVKSCLAIEKYSISSSRINVRLLQQATGEQRSMLINPAEAYHGHGLLPLVLYFKSGSHETYRCTACELRRRDRSRGRRNR